MKFLRMTLACAWAFTVPQIAAAGLEVCNATDVTQSIAIGYKSGEIWISEGWWNADPGKCVQPVTGNLKNRYYYVRALADGYEFQAEDYSFCVTQKEFTIEGDTECEARGYTKSQFIEIDTGETATHYTKAITSRLSIPSESTDPVQEGKLSGGKGNGKPEVEAAALQNGISHSGGAISSGLSPAENAEPFTKVGHFQNCGSEEGQYMCTFHMEGWKFYAYDGGPTPRAMLDALAGLETGTPVELTGDILYYGDITAEIAAREVRPLPGSDPHGDMLANLQGEWVSLEDPASKMTVSGLEMDEAYGDDGIGVRFLQLADSCDASGGSGPVLIQTNPEDQEPQCYLVARADGANLDLIYFARGNTLRYGRP